MKRFIRYGVRRTIQWFPKIRLALHLLPATRTLNVQCSPEWVERIFRRIFTSIARYTNYIGPIERRVRYHGSNVPFSMSLDVSEYTQCGYYFNAPNPELSSLLLRGGKLFIDVGANVGFFTILASPHFTRVVAFEPTPSTYKRLKDNVLFNALSNVEIHPCALSDKIGEAVLYENPLNRGGNSLEGFNENYIIESGKSGWGSYSIATSTLDEFIQGRGFDKIDLIKLDVEGHEGRVLLGARNCLSKYLPILFVEISSVSRYKQLKQLLPREYRGWDPITRCEIDESSSSWKRSDVLFSIVEPW